MGKCYCLKSGLSKRAVYQAIAANNTIGSKLPAAKDCTFKRNRNFYWLRFFGEDCDYQICFHQSFGRYLVRFMKEEYWAQTGRIHETDLHLVYIPEEYLQEKGMLRQARGISEEERGGMGRNAVSPGAEVKKE